MPYITGDRREAIDTWLKDMQGKVNGGRFIPDELDGPQDCGELNYALTMVCIGHNRLQYGALDEMLRAIGLSFLHDKPLRYQRINDLVGACHGAAMELERRRPGAKKFEAITLIYLARSLYAEIGVGYELRKIAENGDIDFGESADAAALDTMRGKK